MGKNAKKAASAGTTEGKARLSPELAELLHMLGSLERQSAGEPAAPRA